MIYTPTHLDRWSPDGPTVFDSAANYSGADLSACYVAPVSVNRDTGDPVTISNWRAVTAELEPLIEHEQSGIHRFGHWACGWYELFLIHPSDSAALARADELAARLADYPVADESDLSDAELDAQSEAWEAWARREFASAVAERLSDAEIVFEASEIEDYPELDELFRATADAGCVYWESYSEGVSIDVARVAAEISDADLETLRAWYARTAPVWVYTDNPTPELIAAATAAVPRAVVCHFFSDSHRAKAWPRRGAWWVSDDPFLSDSEADALDAVTVR